MKMHVTRRLNGGYNYLNKNRAVEEIFKKEIKMIFDRRYLGGV
jgi:hypothetical protein